MDLKRRPRQRCSQCNKVKPLTIQYFKGHSSRKSCWDSRCRDCIRGGQRTVRQLYREAGKKAKKCKICGKRHPKIVLDHCRKTKQFRGWLCRECNLGLGKFNDDLEGLMKAVKYLQDFNEKIAKK